MTYITVIFRPIRFRARSLVSSQHVNKPTFLAESIFDSDGPLTSLDTSRGISHSADGRFVSYFSDGAPYVARVDYSLARKVVMPELTRPPEFVRLSGTGEQVFVSLRGATIDEDDRLHVFRNPFLVQ